VYSIRTLIRRPGFTAVAVLTLSLGIGVNTAIFSLVDALVFRPLPVEAPERLVKVFNTGQEIAFLKHLPLSLPDYKDYRDQNQVFSALMSYDTLPALLRNGSTSELVSGEIATGNYFEVLGVKPSRGRLFSADDDQPAAAPVTVISHRAWQRRFGGDPSIIGQTIELNGQRFVIVGIVSDQFRGMFRVISSEFWVPMSSLATMVDKNLYGLLQQRRVNQYQTVGRLKPDLTIENATANLQTIARQLEQAYPDSNKNRGATAIPINDIIFDPAADSYIKAASATIMGLAGIVLLIACANLANLTLARAVSTQKEIAVRLALGGRRNQLVRQVVTESMVLAVIGGAVGLLIAVWCNRILNVVELPIPVEVALGLSLDGRVMLFAMATSLITGLAFGLIPAWRASGVDVFPALKEEGRSGSGGQRKAWLRNGLVVAQVTMSLVLLIFAGLAVRSLQNAGLVDPGFNPENMVVGALDLRLNRKSPEQGVVFFRDLIERLNATPGLQSASLVGSTPLSLNIRLTRHSLQQGVSEQDAPLVDTTRIWSGYFATMEIPLIKGREFTETDTDSSPSVAIVNESFAKVNWPNEDPIGKRVFLGYPDLKPFEVVGVARDGKYRTLGEDPRPFIYTSLKQGYEGSATVVVRSATGTSAGIASLRSTIQSLDPTLTVFGLQTMKERIGTSLLLPQYVAGLFGAFGVLGAALAIVGLYGVISYSVSQRTQEMGIRMALGSQRSDVLKLVLTQGMNLTVIGLVIGLTIAAISTRLLSMILYGIRATDPFTFVGVSLLMTFVTLVACYIPARRATKIDPMVALRHD